MVKICYLGSWDLRQLWDHWHESRSSREGGCAICGGPVCVPDFSDLYPLALNLVTDLGDGAGDHCKIRSLTGVGMIYHAGFVFDEVTHEFISNRCIGR